MNHDLVLLRVLVINLRSVACMSSRFPEAKAKGKQYLAYVNISGGAYHIDFDISFAIFSQPPK